MAFTAPEPKPPTSKRTKVVIAVFVTMGMLVLVSAITLGVLWKATGSKTFYAASDSMAPEIREDDTFMTVPIKNGYEIERGLVAVVDPDDFEVDVVIKRIVGLPGESIERRVTRVITASNAHELNP
jgi:signal peptidase I